MPIKMPIMCVRGAGRQGDRMRAARHVQTRLLTAMPNFERLAEEIFLCLSDEQDPTIGIEKTKALIKALRELCR
jgi:hypothetical protein